MTEESTTEPTGSKKEIAKELLLDDDFKGLLLELHLECSKEKPKHDFICSILRQTLTNRLRWRELETEWIANDIYLKVPCFNTDKYVSTLVVHASVIIVCAGFKNACS